MLRKLLTFFMMLMLSVPPAWAQEEAENSPAQNARYADWMTFYYVQKDTSRVVDYLAWLQYSQILEERIALQPPISAFLSVLFVDNPSLIKEWIKAVKFTGETRKIVQHALWLSGNGKRIKELFGSTPDYVKDVPRGLLLAQPETPNDLDMYWGAFSASGDVAYIRKVVDALKEFEQPTPKAHEGMDMRAAAAWSLGANMAQHELAVRVVQDEIKNRPEAIKIALNDVLENVKRKAIPFDARDGDFSAKLLITDEGGAKELLRTKRGDVVAMKIQFSGMALTQDLSADVKYDIKLIAPEGSVYNAAEKNGLAALEGRVPSRLRIFTTPSSLMVQFEPDDALGVYKAVAEIRDNVGQKRVAFAKEIELVE